MLMKDFCLDKHQKESMLSMLDRLITFKLIERELKLPLKYDYVFYGRIHPEIQTEEGIQDSVFCFFRECSHIGDFKERNDSEYYGTFEMRLEVWTQLKQVTNEEEILMKFIGEVHRLTYDFLYDVVDIEFSLNHEKVNLYWPGDFYEAHKFIENVILLHHRWMKRIKEMVSC